MGFGLKEAREAVKDATSNLATVASDTRAAMGALAVLGVVALVVALVALGVGLKARTA